MKVNGLLSLFLLASTKALTQQLAKTETAHTQDKLMERTLRTSCRDRLNVDATMLVKGTCRSCGSRSYVSRVAPVRHLSEQELDEEEQKVSELVAIVAAAKETAAAEARTALAKKLAEAVQEDRDLIIALQAGDISLKEVLSRLETALDLKTGELKIVSKLVEETVMPIVEAGAEATARHTTQKKPKLTKAKAKLAVVEQGKKSQKHAVANEGSRLARVKALISLASLKIAPRAWTHVNSLNTSDEKAALLAELILSKHGLGEQSTDRQASRVRNKLERERDLDGIDTSNILSDGSEKSRRQRRPVVRSEYTSDYEEEQQLPSSFVEASHGLHGLVEMYLTAISSWLFFTCAASVVLLRVGCCGFSL
eukprot:gnl/TRDRNA2_/TRDRNA2_65970_c0_seq1.p1 gnl/TRDRNA2_/TRDRNA2_65970_c0~~gnl/TRDRNA2_/TRDRNA2_65970_c0_seq1.p1  ORF type:complete len:367 (+),score=77.10 gnl/TRDRNA2_/TRDRNA2_65970_c0_seq1:94-1194(+)